MRKRVVSTSLCQLVESRELEIASIIAVNATGCRHAVGGLACGYGSSPTRCSELAVQNLYRERCYMLELANIEARLAASVRRLQAAVADRAFARHMHDRSTSAMSLRDRSCMACRCIVAPFG